jgi:hypothetical protein
VITVLSMPTSRPNVRLRALALAQALILLAALALPAGALAAVTGVTPNSQARGTAQAIVVNGSGGTFPSGAYTITFSGTGVTASGVSRASAIALNATVTVTAGAAIGPRTLTVTGPGGFGGPQTTTYTIVAGTIATTTTITSDTPDPSAVGAAISVGITVAAASGTTSPTGTVTVSDGTVTSAPCALSGSGGSATATCSLTPTTSGLKTLTATYGGSSSFGGSAGTTAHTVLATQAALVLTGTSSPATYGTTQALGTTGGSGTGAVTYTSTTPTVCTLSGSTLTIIAGSGTCSVYATKAADANYTVINSATVNITAQRANQAALVVTGTTSPAGVGTTQALGTTGGSGTGAVTFSTGASTACSVSGSTLTITASTGTCAVTATKAADANYNATTSAPVAITVAPAVLTVTPNPQAVTFGDAVPAYTFVVTGFLPGENAGNAAGYVAPTCTSAYTPATPVASSPLTITCSGGSATDYTFDTTATAALTIAQADPVCSVGGVTVTYDGLPHGATGSCLGVNGETLSGLDLGSTFTDVPGGTADWTFTDVTGNYTGDSGSVDIAIEAADAVVTVTCGPGPFTYDGAAHTPCTATATGPGGLSEALTVSYLDNTDAGTATASAAYAGGPNHYPATGAATFTIDRAATVTTVTCAPGPFTYTGSAQAPCTAAVTGPGGLGQAVTVSYLDNTNAGTATASASYAGGPNHNPSSDSTSFTIDRADAVCTIDGVSVTWDGDAHGATGSCLGVNGETLSGLDLGDSFTDVPGGAADWTLTNPNYYSDAGSVDIVISRAAQAIAFPAIPDVTYGVPSFELQATSDAGLPITYTSLTSGVCTVSGSTVTIVGVRTCTIVAAQAGDGNVLAAQSVTRSFLVVAADDDTPETSTSSPLGVTAGDGPFQRTVLLGLILAGILAATIVLLGYRAGRAPVAPRGSRR